MSSRSLNPETAEVLDQLVTSLEQGRLAHGYIVEGAVEGQARFLVEHFLGRVFGCPPDRAFQQADVLVVEPESKSRVIKTEPIRDLNKMMYQTSYAGGWKAAVLLDAERLYANAANAFLKTLEEPPERSLLFLVSEQPDLLLPTIVSRCQRVVLRTREEAEAASWLPELFDILASSGGEDVMAGLVSSQRISGLLKEVRARAEEEVNASLGEEEPPKDVLEARIRSRELEARSDMLKVMQKWSRDVWHGTLGASPELLFFPRYAEATRGQAAHLDPVSALKRVERWEETARRLNQNLPGDAVFEMGELTFLFERSGAVSTRG